MKIKTLLISGNTANEKEIISSLNEVKQSILDKTSIELSGVKLVKYLCEYYLKNERNN